MSNALHVYAKVFRKYAERNGGTGVALTAEDCLALSDEMHRDADNIDSWNNTLQKHRAQLSERALELGTENKKLWELVIMYNDYISQDRCEGCILKSQCNDGKVSECWQLTEIRERARELGVEVK